MRQFIVIAIAICLTQLASGEIGETRVPETGVATEVSSINVDVDVIPKEVRDSLHESELLQDPVHSFVETLHTSAHATHEIMSADEAISALAKRAKNELNSDLDSKKMTTPQAPHQHRSRAAKRAAQKISARTTSQQAKREAKKKRKSHKVHHKSSRKRTFVALETKKTKGKVHHRDVLHRAMAALHTAKSAVRKTAKNKMKANKTTRSALRRHGGHAEKTKVHWARLSQSQCHGQCASANMKEFQRTCKQQCAKTDYACLQRCTFPMRKCKCSCSQQHLWTCSGARCGCWKLQHRDHGEVSQAMMKAENEALSKGLGHRVAKKWASDARHKALAKAQARATTQRRLKIKKKAASLVETKKWLHTIF